jgi:hypothetical protein
MHFSQRCQTLPPLEVMRSPGVLLGCLSKVIDLVPSLQFTDIAPMRLVSDLFLLLQDSDSPVFHNHVVIRIICRTMVSWQCIHNVVPDSRETSSSLNKEDVMVLIHAKESGFVN